MNFNHLMEARLLKRKCRVNKTECYWMPVGNIRSTHGDNVHMTMYCKHCGVREDIFLSKQDYDTQEKMILKEIQSV
jgi:hypothetical protein